MSVHLHRFVVLLRVKNLRFHRLECSVVPATGQDVLEKRKVSFSYRESNLDFSVLRICGVRKFEEARLLNTADVFMMLV